MQGAVGFGLGLIGAPLLLLIDPYFVPGPLLVSSLCLTLLLARREWASIRFGDLAWSLPGRLIGTIAAVLFLRTVPTEHLAGILGGLVLAAVVISALGVPIRLRGRTLFGAGTLAGFMGTTTSIGGPPIALLYQREHGPRVRGTLSAFFVVGVSVSLIGLVVAGRFGVRELHLAGVLLPGIPVGFLLSHRAARILDKGWTRPAILTVSAIAGVMVLVKYLI